MVAVVGVGGVGRGGQARSITGGKKNPNTFKDCLPERKSLQVTSHDRETHEKRLSSRAISRISEPTAENNNNPVTVLDPVHGSAGGPRAPQEGAFI